jgi:DNA-binding HxlR family transcriptional regulator
MHLFTKRKQLLLVPGNRLREVERSIPSLNFKALAKELKNLEEHQLIKGTGHDSSPVMAEYKALAYAESLHVVTQAPYD